MSLTTVTDPANGTAAIDNNGTPADPSDDFIHYTPDGNWSGSDSFSYTIEDVDGDSDTAIVTVDVSLVDDLPDAVDDTASTAEDTPVDIDVLANDTGLGDGLAVPMRVDCGH